MAATDTIEAFAQELRQDAIAQASLEGEETSVPAALTMRFIEDLAEVAELEGGYTGYVKGRGYATDGYFISEDGSRLDLFYTIMGSVPPRTVTRSEVETGFTRLRGFYFRARKGLHNELEESTPEWDMAASISELIDLRRLRLYVFTDGLTTLEAKPDEQLEGVQISHHVWDLNRLYRADTSGHQQEPIDIDLVGSFGEAIPCLAAPTPSPDYTAHLAIIPGRILSAIYDQYGGRLLERNVRAFLQARNRVNRGLQETIAKEPERFLAYNNGISATASEVELVLLPDGGHGIARLRDFQVVNGGQTTASIHYAEHKAKVPIDDIYVQAKITVVDPSELGTIVPLISRYANSQTKVNEADFLANEPFHVAVENLSRTVWAPAQGGAQRETKWFYERARGQYQDALSRELTPARRREFQRRNPPGQRFTKTDLAKFENSWDQLPHIVSLGAEKNFQHFTARLSTRQGFRVTRYYYHQLVAKAILFRSADRIIGRTYRGQGYKANIVAYSVAYLSWMTDQCVDLSGIWRSQEVTPAVGDSIEEISEAIREVIFDPPGSGNISEWCKKKECWEEVLTIRLPMAKGLKSELVQVDPDSWRLEERVLQALERSSHPMGKADIMAAADLPEWGWSATIRSLVEQGRVVREGERRGAVYHLPS